MTHAGVPTTAARDWRLHKHADYQRVYKSSRKQFSARIAYFVAPQPDEWRVAGPRVGITAGRVLGKAVDRNRIKRRLRAAICCHLAVLQADLDVVLHPKRNVVDAPWAELSAEVKRIFQTIQKSSAGRAAAATVPAATAQPGA